MADKTVIEILDYWNIIELLTQDAFCSGAVDINSNIKLQKEKIKNKDTNISKSLIGLVYLRKNADDIYSSIEKLARECKMTRWGNLTIYIGRIKRERIIKDIIDIIAPGEYDKRPEKDSDDIAAVSLQLSPEGKYIDGSISISPVLWVHSNLIKKKSFEASKITIEAYEKYVSETEKVLFDKEILIKEAVQSDNEAIQNNLKSIQKFDGNAVTFKRIKKIWDYIKEKHLTEFKADKDYDQDYAIVFPMYFDEIEKNNASEDDYTGLSRNFFSKDIRLVEDYIINNRGEKADQLKTYIKAILCDKKKKELLNREYSEDYYEMMEQLINIKNAPIAKWPSKYRPAFMQQIAVNIFKSNSGDEHGEIFSVNGPPGTGKTTLLKEIIADHIVERANILSNYEDPDLLFERRRIEDKEKYEGYVNYYPSFFYVLKDDTINNYNIIVTSSNNSAVENVSKDFPTKLLDEIPEELYEWIYEYQITIEREKVKNTDTKETVIKEFKDIYFTRQAKELFGDDGWGLVSIPLGKQANIKNFAQEVLFSIYSNHLTDRKKIEETKTLYRKVRNEFAKQYKKVTNLKIAHEKIIEFEKSLKISETKLKQAEKDHIHAKKQLKETIRESEELIGVLYENKKNTQQELDEYHKLKKQYIENAKSIADLEKKSENELLHLSWKMMAFKIIMGITYIFSFFLNGLYEYIKDCYDKTKTKNDRTLSIQRDRALAKNNAEDGVGKCEIRINELIGTLKEINTQINSEQKRIQQAKSTEEALAKKHAVIKGEYEQLLKDYSVEKEKIGEYTTFDEKMSKDLLSAEVEESTKAHVDNPWTTKTYDIEREKLFLLALKLNKLFIYSSKSVAENLDTLNKYWGYSKNKGDGARLIFSENDKLRMVGVLYQTLLLLCPVISTTFASVGRMFKDVKQPNVFGTLIVDEAGQAQPQMALGALYRCRNAIIVGDPKQVEPVVTDELKVLKEAICKGNIHFYKEKKLSVQHLADALNTFGAYYGKESQKPEWVGCPLVVHRRCISPMYEISNQVSYDGIMRTQTKPPSKNAEGSFSLKYSIWVDIKGPEKGDKNHFVEEQGKTALKIITNTFKNVSKVNEEIDKKERNRNKVAPDIFVISPYKSVSNEFKEYVKKECKNPVIRYYLLNGKIGTVHTFQGKEASEVIFMLGCDENSIKSTTFVNSNIVNVAASRAKYRLYALGNINVWKDNIYVRQMYDLLIKNEAECKKASEKDTS